jgi:hypothetical protein
MRIFCRLGALNGPKHVFSPGPPSIFASPSRFANVRRLIENCTFSLDSPLEEEGFELLVPPQRGQPYAELAPSFFEPGCTGCDHFNHRE